MTKHSHQLHQTQPPQPLQPSPRHNPNTMHRQRTPSMDSGKSKDLSSTKKHSSNDGSSSSSSGSDSSCSSSNSGIHHRTSSASTIHPSTPKYNRQIPNNGIHSSSSRMSPTHFSNGPHRRMSPRMHGSPRQSPRSPMQSHLQHPHQLPPSAPLSFANNVMDIHHECTTHPKRPSPKKSTPYKMNAIERQIYYIILTALVFFCCSTVVLMWRMHILYEFHSGSFGNTSHKHKYDTYFGNARNAKNARKTRKMIHPMDAMKESSAIVRKNHFQKLTAMQSEGGDDGHWHGDWHEVAVQTKGLEVPRKENGMQAGQDIPSSSGASNLTPNGNMERSGRVRNDAGGETTPTVKNEDRKGTSPFKRFMGRGVEPTSRAILQGKHPWVRPTTSDTTVTTGRTDMADKTQQISGMRKSFQLPVGGMSEYDRQRQMKLSNGPNNINQYLPDTERPDRSNRFDKFASISNQRANNAKLVPRFYGTTAADSKPRLFHVLETRFMQHQPNLIELAKARLLLFESFCLPSVLGQTVLNGKEGENDENDDDHLEGGSGGSGSVVGGGGDSPPFIWVIRTDPDLDLEIREELVKLLKENDALDWQPNTDMEGDESNVSNDNGKKDGARRKVLTFVIGSNDNYIVSGSKAPATTNSTGEVNPNPSMNSTSPESLYLANSANSANDAKSNNALADGNGEESTPTQTDSQPFDLVHMLSWALDHPESVFAGSTVAMQSLLHDLSEDDASNAYDANYVQSEDSQDVVLWTRLDADDALHQEFMEYVQNQALRYFLPKVYALENYSENMSELRTVMKKMKERDGNDGYINAVKDNGVGADANGGAVAGSAGASVAGATSASGSKKQVVSAKTTSNVNKNTNNANNKGTKTKNTSTTKAATTIPYARPEWTFWCARRGIEWFTTDDQSPKHQKGTVYPVQHTNHCVTPGITIGLRRNVDPASIPRLDHDKIVSFLKPDFEKLEEDHRGDANGKGKDVFEMEREVKREKSGLCGRNGVLSIFDDEDEEEDDGMCFHMINQLPIAALRSRTPTSAGMLGVTPNTLQIEMMKQKPEFKQIFWDAIEDWFHVEDGDLVRTNRYFKEKVYDIAVENGKGQCTKGHSCKSSSKDSLQRYGDLKLEMKGGMDIVNGKIVPLE